MVEAREITGDEERVDQRAVKGLQLLRRVPVRSEDRDGDLRVLAGDRRVGGCRPVGVPLAVPLHGAVVENGAGKEPHTLR
jgi:hypothetical protein